MSDEQNIPVEGQDISNVDSAEEQTTEPFFSYEYTDEKGQVNPLTFGSPDELKEHLKNSSMMRSDYTRKTQALAEQRKQFENDRAMFTQMNSELQRKADEYKRFDEMLKNRPDVYQELKRRLEGSPDSNTQQEVMMQRFEKEYGQKMKKFESFLRQQEVEKKRQEAFDELKGQYEDFDGDLVTQALENLARGSTKDLAEMLYLAGKGRASLGDVEKKVIQNLAKKQNAGLMRHNVGVSANTGKREPKDLNEALIMATEEYN